MNKDDTPSTPPPDEPAIDTTNITTGVPGFDDILGGGLVEGGLYLIALDTVPKFVQLIKLVQQEVGLGSERVRGPRLPLEGEERDEALALIRERLAARP